MSNFSPRDCFRPRGDLRVREVPEWGCLLVYTPSRPKVHYLDARSWLIFELCDGRTYDSLLAEFSEAVPDGTSAEEVRRAVDKGLQSLVSSEIVDHAPAVHLAGDKASVG